MTYEQITWPHKAEIITQKYLFSFKIVSKSVIAGIFNSVLGKNKLIFCNLKPDFYTGHWTKLMDSVAAKSTS